MASRRLTCQAASDARRSTRAILWPTFLHPVILYTADVTAIASVHNARVHTCADDTATAVLLLTVQRWPLNFCVVSIDDVSRWMSSDRLKLNVDKTQFIWLGAPRQLQQVSRVQLVVDGVPISNAHTVRDLGVTLDTRLSFQQHVDSVVRSYFYQLRQLRSVRRSVPDDAMCTLVAYMRSSQV